MDIKAVDKKYVADTYARFDLEIVGGSGSVLYGADGKQYIDLGTGIAVNTFGVCDPEWTSAVTEQLGKFQHTSNLYYSAPCALLAEELCIRTGATRVFFGNSGAEANECAIKAARKWAEDKFGEGSYNIITLKNSFHGRTIATLKATGQDTFHKSFGPFPDGFVYAEANNLESVKSLAENTKCCAVMMELVQGEGGVIALDKDFVKGVEALCRERDILLIIDEVQTGNGRCGEIYAYMHYSIHPDIVTTAKGLGGGLPIGAAILFDRLENTFVKGSHGSTFGGNPIAAAGALSIIKRLDEKTLSEVRKKSEYIISALKNAKGIKNITGLGLMLGIETVADVNTVLTECMSRGILPIKAKNKLRLLPALNIPDELLKEAISTLKQVARETAEALTND